MNISLSGLSTRSRVGRNLLAAVLPLCVLAPAQLHAASVNATISANSGAAVTNVNDTSPGPSISRSVLEENPFAETFASADVSADLTTASLRVRTDTASTAVFNASVNATASMDDTLTFAIDQGASDFIDIGIRFHLEGTLFSSDALNGSGSIAELGLNLISFNGAGATDTLITERRYGKLPSSALESVSIADPDTFFVTTAFGDIIFDNSDFGNVEGTIRLVGAAPTLDIALSLRGQGITDLFNTATFEFTDLPSDVTFTSESGYFLVPVPAAVWLFVSALGVLGWRARKLS